MKKTAFIVIIIVILAGLALAYGPFEAFAPKEAPAPMAEEMPGMERYVSAGYGFSFMYPEGYFVDEGRSETFAHDWVSLIEDTEFNRRLVAGEVPATEGPVSIRVDIFLGAVAEGGLESWVRESRYSNFPLATTELSPVTVAGASGFAYSHDGLYMNDAVVLGSGGTVYMLSVSYTSPDDEIRDDFQAVIDTFSFDE